MSKRGCVTVIVLGIILLLAIIVASLGSTDEAQPSAAKVQTPHPTPTLSFCPTCAEILVAKNEMTQAQWMDYLKQTENQWTNEWLCTIKEVEQGGIGLTSGYTVRLESDDGCDVAFTLKNKDEALSLSDNQRVWITGQIDRYETTLGLTIYLKDNPTISK